jgi:CBS domain-containing protein
MNVERPHSGSSAQELADVIEFLRGSLPFNALPDADLERVAAALRVSYHPHSGDFRAGAEDPGLRILRSGAVDIRDDDNKLLDRLGEGESFHIDGLNAEHTGVVATVIEDALVYRLPDEEYRALRAANRDVDRYFSGQRNRRLRRAARYQPEPHAMLAPVSSVMTREPLTLGPQLSVREAAVAMAIARVSSAFVVDGEKLLGIVTDRDFRTRVLATGLDSSVELREVMTREPQYIDAHATLFAATLLMTRRAFHHLPVLDEGRLVGVLTTSDLILARRDDPVYLVQHIGREDGAEGIRDLLAGLPDLLAQWVGSGMHSQQVSQILTAISDAVTTRLICLAEQELGPAPAPWAWLAFGSQARGEQLLGADQDNGMVIDDAVADADLEWFAALARRVSDGLALCGYRYCPGDVMATSDSWRLRLADWQETVRRWAREPTPDAVMRVSIFFDIRPVHGEARLADALQEVMLEQASSNTIFQAALAANILDSQPPLGVFRRFVVDRDEQHRDTVDIKKRGVLPVTEIVRLHALAHRLRAVKTDERLAELARSGHMTLVDSRNLADALHCLQRIRMEHQREQILAGEAVDNHMDPRRLPRLAREQLRDAFTIIDEAQAAVRQTSRAGMG